MLRIGFGFRLDDWFRINFITRNARIWESWDHGSVPEKLGSPPLDRADDSCNDRNGEEYNGIREEQTEESDCGRDPESGIRRGVVCIETVLGSFEEDAQDIASIKRVHRDEVEHKDNQIDNMERPDGHEPPRGCVAVLENERVDRSRGAKWVEQYSLG